MLEKRRGAPVWEELRRALEAARAETAALRAAAEGADRGPRGLPLTSLCELPLLFVYFQVNNGILYFLDYVEDIYINHGSSLFSFQCSGFVFTVYVTVYYYYAPCFILFLKLFNDWGRRGYDDSVPGEVTKTSSSGDRTT